MEEEEDPPTRAEEQQQRRWAIRERTTMQDRRWRMRIQQPTRCRGGGVVSQYGEIYGHTIEREGGDSLSRRSTAADIGRAVAVLLKMPEEPMSKKEKPDPFWDELLFPPREPAQQVEEVMHPLREVATLADEVVFPHHALMTEQLRQMRDGKIPMPACIEMLHSYPDLNAMRACCTATVMRESFSLRL
ncbi:hypothetical protein PR202_gb17213 [Eleusine coracana subsp. coracana]|uniref:Uncharacterized protein n=1 Tax=Eleusine coracana subsp. coracana TaxID=191504 RepID=A0AAV5F415_ELECO|nr:hypothetical protein PR202_gb17213 [Eleusine coracana subsp. coracana]